MGESGGGRELVVCGNGEKMIRVPHSGFVMVVGVGRFSGWGWVLERRSVFGDRLSLFGSVFDKNIDMIVWQRGRTLI